MKCEAKQAAKKLSSSNTVAALRLELVRDLKTQLAGLRDQLSDESYARAAAEEGLLEEKELRRRVEVSRDAWIGQVEEDEKQRKEEDHLREKLERMKTIRAQIKRERKVGRRGGAGR